MAAPALALAPMALGAAKKGVDTIVELGKTPVIGWQRTVSYDKGRKNVKHIVEHTGIELRAWEIGLAAFLALILISTTNSSGIPGGFLNPQFYTTFDPFNLLGTHNKK